MHANVPITPRVARVQRASRGDASASRNARLRAPVTRFVTASDASSSSNGDANARRTCPVCGGTGWKPCGQCEGTGVNREDLFAGKFKAGDACWLCAGKAKTMCGNCVDLTDTF